MGRLNLDPHKILFEPSRIELLDVPRSTKQFLSTHGLPRTHALNISFSGTDGTFPQIDAYCQSRGLPHPPDGGDLYRIGSDEGTQICLERGSGTVVSIDPEGKHRPRFINSNIELMIEFLNLYAEYASGAQSLAEERALRLVATTKMKMREIDEAAFKDENTWWAVVCEQMEHGIL